MCRRLFPLALAMLLVLAVSGCSQKELPPPKDWQRMDAAGLALDAADSSAHACVLDLDTGLMWQVHDQAGGLHDADNRYSWFNSDRQVHMTEPGQSDGGQCAGSACDTEAYVAAVNEAGLCGHADWRMPGRQELMSLGELRLRETGLLIDRAYFPQAQAGEYWSGETFRLYPQTAWAVDFSNGLDRADLKTEAKRVRLVRLHGQSDPNHK